MNSFNVKYFTSFNHRLYTAQEWVNRCVQKFGLENEEPLRLYYVHPKLSNEFKKVMVPNWLNLQVVLKELQKPKFEPELTEFKPDKLTYNKQEYSNCSHRKAVVEFVKNGKTMCDCCCNHETTSICSTFGTQTCVDCCLNLTNQNQKLQRGYEYGTNSKSHSSVRKSLFSQLKVKHEKLIREKILREPIFDLDEKDSDFKNQKTKQIRSLKEVIELKVDREIRKLVKKYKTDGIVEYDDDDENVNLDKYIDDIDIGNNNVDESENVKPKPKVKSVLSDQKLKSKILKELRGYGYEESTVQKCFEIFTKYLDQLEKTTRGKPRKQLVESCFYIVLGKPENYTGNVSYVEQVESVI